VSQRGTEQVRRAFADWPGCPPILGRCHGDLDHSCSTRLTAQLIEAAAERHLWAETYDRPAVDVLRLQSEVAREIARQINVTVTPEQRSRLTSAREVNPKVYEACLRGKFYVSQNTPESFEKGMQYLHQAVEIDPAEPLGYVGLAEGYVTLGHGGAEQIDSFPRARAAAEQALKLDPDIAEAVGALADVALYYEWDWVKAEKLFKRALELNPSLVMTHYHYAWYLALFNRLDEAIAEQKLARDHDPLRPLHRAWLGWLYNAVGRYDEAIVEAKKALELNPKFWPSYRVLRVAYSRKGMHQEAIAAAQRHVEIAPIVGNAMLGAAYALAGRREQALTIAAKLKRGAPDTSYYLAEFYTALGDRDAALRELEAAYQAHITALPWIRVHGGDFDGLRDDPRFQDLVRRMELPL
jgi:adenylate cyclase